MNSHAVVRCQCSFWHGHSTRLKCCCCRRRRRRLRRRGRCRSAAATITRSTICLVFVSCFHYAAEQTHTPKTYDISCSFVNLVSVCRNKHMHNTNGRSHKPTDCRHTLKWTMAFAQKNNKKKTNHPTLLCCLLAVCFFSFSSSTAFLRLLLLEIQHSHDVVRSHETNTDADRFTRNSFYKYMLFSHSRRFVRFFSE